MRKITNEDIDQAARRVAVEILANCRMAIGVPIKLYGIPRGGIPAAYAVARFAMPCIIVDDPSQADWIIDDIVDSGAIRDRYMVRYQQAEFASLFTAKDASDWLSFPWERGLTEEDDADDHSATDIPLRLLQYIGEDTKREGLRETPQRFLAAWNHYTQGYKEDPKEILKTFEDGAHNYDEMVLVKDIPVYSTCEHHLATFVGVAHVSYIPNGKVVGLSKLVRLVECFARRLQVQERLTQQIANALNDNLQPVGVGVVLSCRHFCMEARGVRAPGTTTVTSCMLGAMREDKAARAELLELIR